MGAAPKQGTPLRVLVTGSTGLIGSSLVTSLTTGGHTVNRLVRSEPEPGQRAFHWDPETGLVDVAGLEGLDAVVHLAGENVAGRWTRWKKAKIRTSRVQGTRLISESLARARHPPKVLVCASAIGYYGDRGEEILREDAPPGVGFLSEVCREWEAAAEPARRSGIRVVHLRTGIVLTTEGGALAKMLFPFQIGLGGKLGTGKQYWSWIALEDLVSVILHAVTNDNLQGPVNAVAPNPVTNIEFTRTLGRVLSRPTIASVPAFVARLVLGEAADNLLLASTRVLPTRLLATGYRFQFLELGGALRHILRKGLKS